MRGDGRRVARLDDAHALQRQRLVRRLDLELAPAPGAPPRRAERRVRASIREEAVHEEVPGAALADELVAVALASVRITRALHPHPADLGPLAAAHDEIGVRAVVVFEVEERAEDRVRGDRHRLLFLEKRVQRLDKRMARIRLRVEGAPVERRARGAERAGADALVRLVGQRRGEEHPPLRLHAADVEPHRAAHDLRRHVRRLGGTLLLERTAAHFGLRTHAERPSHSLLAHRDVLQLRDAPVRDAGRELLVVCALRLEDEPAAPGKLGGRRIRPEHPHDGLHHVLARCELRFVGLVEPVLDDAPVRTERDRCAVQQQLETLVRAHVESQRRRVRRKLFPEAQKGVLAHIAALNRRRMPNPARVIDLLQTRHVRIAALEPLGPKYLPHLINCAVRREGHACSNDTRSQQHTYFHSFLHYHFLLV